MMKVYFGKGLFEVPLGLIDNLPEEHAPSFFFRSADGRAFIPIVESTGGLDVEGFQLGVPDGPAVGGKIITSSGEVNIEFIYPVL